eukprot:GHVR01187249.1.p1 GENE.GHVR01187249.1~~GHVR01187249.1.p1  ORF type:complete len:236 (+),score=42.50 GHVR01187249.1:596-1303(+)
MFFGSVAIAQVPIGDDASVTRVGVVGLAGTGTVGQVTLVTDQNLNQTGLSATGAVGTAAAGGGTGVIVIAGGSVGTAAVGSVEAIINVQPVITGVAATGAVGDLEVTGTAVVQLTGVQATASTNAVEVIINVQPTIVGVAANGELNDVEVIGDANVPQTGLSATTAVGIVSQRTTAVIPITFDPQAQGQSGSVTVTGGATINLVGVEGSGRVGTVVVWGRIIPDEDTIWTEIVAA